MRPTAGGPGAPLPNAGGPKLAPNGRLSATLPEPIKRARAKDLAGSLARAMWLSGVSECERSETRGAPTFIKDQTGSDDECGQACYVLVFIPIL
jgi:hypothetical protein